MGSLVDNQIDYGTQPETLQLLGFWTKLSNKSLNVQEQVFVTWQYLFVPNQSCNQLLNTGVKVLKATIPCTPLAGLHGLH